MKCLFDIHKNRWIPQEISDINKIDIINIDKRIKIFEEYENNFELEEIN